MKKYLIVGFVVLSLFIGSVTYAETAPGSNPEVRIAELQAQINKLLAEIARLKGSTNTDVQKAYPIEYRTPADTGGYITEQVKCIFNGYDEQEHTCSTVGATDLKASCVGGTTCVSSVNAKKGTKINWESSCRGKAETVVDGVSEYAVFACAGGDFTKPTEPIRPVKQDTKTYPKFVVVSPNGGEALKIGETYKLQWKGGNPDGEVIISLAQINPYNATVNRGIPVLTKLVTTKNDGAEEVKIPTVKDGRYLLLVETLRTRENNQVNIDYSDRQFTVTSKSTKYTIADVNYDGKVNGSDHDIVEDNLGACPKQAVSTDFLSNLFPNNYCHSDLNNDNVVDDRDLEIVTKASRKK